MVASPRAGKARQQRQQQQDVEHAEQLQEAAVTATIVSSCGGQSAAALRARAALKQSGLASEGGSVPFGHPHQQHQKQEAAGWGDADATGFEEEEEELHNGHDPLLAAPRHGQQFDGDILSELQRLRNVGATATASRGEGAIGQQQQQQQQGHSRRLSSERLRGSSGDSAPRTQQQQQQQQYQRRLGSGYSSGSSGSAAAGAKRSWDVDGRLGDADRSGGTGLTGQVAKGTGASSGRGAGVAAGGGDKARARGVTSLMASALHATSSSFASAGGVKVLWILVAVSLALTLVATEKYVRASHRLHGMESLKEALNAEIDSVRASSSLKVAKVRALQQQVAEVQGMCRKRSAAMAGQTSRLEAQFKSMTQQQEQKAQKTQAAGKTASARGSGAAAGGAAGAAGKGAQRGGGTATAAASAAKGAKGSSHTRVL